MRQLTPRKISGDRHLTPGHWLKISSYSHDFNTKHTQKIPGDQQQRLGICICSVIVVCTICIVGFSMSMKHCLSKRVSKLSSIHDNLTVTGPYYCHNVSIEIDEQSSTAALIVCFPNVHPSKTEVLFRN